MGDRVALIPARGGSQRIPRKNIRDFLGKPALARTIAMLRSSQVFDSIYVSTDDHEIAAVAREAGASVPFMRPESLSDHFIGARPVIQHAVESLKLNDATTVGVFYPTAVLLRESDVRDSCEVFNESEVEFVFSVGEFPAPISRALIRNEAGLIAPMSLNDQSTRTQDLQAGFYDLGQFYWGATRSWLGDTSVVSAVTHGYVIEPWRAIDIDTPDDWHRAELMYRVLHDLA